MEKNNPAGMTKFVLCEGNMEVSPERGYGDIVQGT